MLFPAIVFDLVLLQPPCGKKDVYIVETVRSFIALELSPQIHRQMAQAQEQLKKSEADVKWVNPGQIHLTLKFLGNVSPQIIAEIKKVIGEIARNHKGFELTIGRLGAFPGTGHPRVIWIGIERGLEQSLALAQALEKQLIKLGFLPEKRAFKPHLTLGRVRSGRNRAQLKELLQSVSVLPETMRVEKIVLFKSALQPEGAIYQSLYEVNLS